MGRLLNVHRALEIILYQIFFLGGGREEGGMSQTLLENCRFQAFLSVCEYLVWELLCACLFRSRDRLSRGLFMPVATARFFRTQRRSMRRHRTKRSSPKSADQVGSCSVLSTCVPLVVCSACVCLSTHFLSMHTHLSVVRCICVFILSVLRLCKVLVLSAENPELSV